MRDETSYRAIAPYYDWIMAHVDYDAWGRYLGKLWRKGRLEPRLILELGAGTCPFARRDVFPPEAKAVYTDLSPYMLARAPALEPDLRTAANALALPFKGGFDLCLMIYDAFNYLMDAGDARRCLDEVHRVLAPGGLFLFDVTTEANSRRHFDQAVDFGEMAGCTYFRESRYDYDTRVQGNDFVFFLEERDGRFRKVKESHQQRIYPVGELRALATAAGFAVEGVFEGFTFRPARETSERIHFMLRKPAA